ncbi:MAG: hypothetical protein Q4B67_00070 [Eubacteriales bacterium]|nr:hypothetical protein [Eubacteriales bacterium]
MKKVLMTTAFAILATVMLCMYSFAADPEPKDFITDASFDYNYETGTVRATWEKTDAKSNYIVKFYYGNTISGRQPLYTWKNISGYSKDVTTYIAKKGTGKYIFTVTSVKDPSEAVYVSDVLELDSDDLKKIKARAKVIREESIDRTPGWHSNPDGTWFYYKEDRTQLKNDWLDYEGKRYHFSSAGVMEVGWQVIKNYWYYFDKSGALLVSTTTPDGYPVDAEGRYVDAEGKPISAKGASKTPATPTKLTNVSISLSEKSNGAEKIKTLTLNGGTGIKIVNTTYSIPFENWSVDTTVAVTLEIEAKPNYYFSGDLKVTCRNVERITVSGSGDRTRKVTLYYNPKTVLAKPEVVYINEYEELHWNKIQHATRYKVMVYYDNKLHKSVTVEENKLELYEYLNPLDDVERIKVKIVAMGPQKKTVIYQESAAYEIADIEVFKQTNMVNGRLTVTPTRVKYENEYGEQADGWVELLGHWMYFKKGVATINGWYKDTKGDWYYLNQYGFMQTGWLEKDGHRYYLRETSETGPTGSMVQGTAVISGKEYHFNDGTRTDIPVGANY